MRKFIRSVTPDILLEPVGPNQQPRWQLYGERYRQNRATNAGHQFQWPDINGKPLNQHLLPNLRTLTDSHCAYCDQYPLRKAEESIDHFLPKSDPKFYGLVCQWENLYLSCVSCQSRSSEYLPALLRPDETTFSFERYFVYDFFRHHITINEQASPADQHRAETTIRLFKLNDDGNPGARRIALDRWLRTNPAERVVDDFNFRYLLDF